jgi:hypothetical protein
MAVTGKRIDASRNSIWIDEVPSYATVPAAARRPRCRYSIETASDSANENNHGSASWQARWLPLPALPRMRQGNRMWHGASAPSPRLPSGRLRRSLTGYGEGRGEGAFPLAQTRGGAPAPGMSAKDALIPTSPRKRGEVKAGQSLFEPKTSAPRSKLKVRNARIVVGPRRRSVRSIHWAPIEPPRSIVSQSVSVVPVEPSRSMVPHVPRMSRIGARHSRNRTKCNSGADSKDQNFTHHLAPFVVPPALLDEVDLTPCCHRPPRT